MLRKGVKKRDVFTSAYVNGLYEIMTSQITLRFQICGDWCTTYCTCLHTMVRKGPFFLCLSPRAFLSQLI